MRIRKQELRVTPVGQPLFFSALKGFSEALHRQKLYNISRSGLFVQADVLPNPGETFEFTLSTDVQEIRGEGQVRWCKEGHASAQPRGFGVEISHFSGHDQQIYLQMLNQYLKDLRVRDLLMPSPMMFSSRDALRDLIEYFRAPDQDFAVIEERGVTVGVYESHHIVDLLLGSSDLSQPISAHLLRDFERFDSMMKVDAAIKRLNDLSQNYFPVVQNQEMIGVVSRLSMNRAWTELLELKIQLIQVSQSNFCLNMQRDVEDNLLFMQSVLSMVGHKNGLSIDEFFKVHLRELLEGHCHQSSNSIKTLSSVLDQKKQENPVLLVELTQKLCHRFSGWLENQNKFLEWDLYEVAQVSVLRSAVHVREVISALIMRGLSKTGVGQGLFLTASRTRESVRMKMYYKGHKKLAIKEEMLLDFDVWEDIHVLDEDGECGLYVDLPLGPSGVVFNH
ncbi:MAG: PilZ domain-containing protein [Oligoflexales bacterium]